jgi:hypothetical protein
MNELELLCELRSEIAGPNAVELAAGRVRLIAEITPRRRIGPRRLRAMMVALAVAATAAAAAGVIATVDRAAPVSAPASHMTLAAEVLHAAAARLGAEPSPRPAPSQWIYSVVAQAGGGGGSGVPNWMTFDGSGSAYYFHGRLIVHHHPHPPAVGRTAMARFLDTATPETAYDALMALPRRPRALLAAVAHTVVTHPAAVTPPAASPPAHPTPGQQQFDFLATLLRNAAQASPARADAAAYHALATIPGVSAERTRDAVQRPAIALAVTGGDQQLLLDPRSYWMTGLRTVSDGSWPVNPNRRNGPTYPRGAVILSLAWAQIALVTGPGQR